MVSDCKKSRFLKLENLLTQLDLHLIFLESSNPINHPGLSWFIEKTMFFGNKKIKNAQKIAKNHILCESDDFWRKSCNFWHVITIMCL